MDTNTIKHNKFLLEKTAESLARNGFNDVKAFDTAKEAKELIKSLIKPKSVIAMGGSVTIKELDFSNELKDVEILQHKPEMGIQERRQIWRKVFSADYYFASPQAITLDGKMYFLDMYGNRAAAVIFGPEHVILMAGYNKIVKDEPAALYRSKNVAAVENTHRLNKNTPCIKTWECSDCNSSDRICRVMTVLYKRPAATEYTIILVNEHLGF